MTIEYTRRQSKKNNTVLTRLNTMQGKLLLIAMAVCLIVVYVYQTSVLATRTFVINELQQELRTLEQEQQSLDVQIAEHRSLQHIESRLAQKNYVRATEMAYISGIGTTVASR